ncbi:MULTISPECIES: hypothetical protein [unclassified Halomonas]|uniref:hypothetical protein n=1 Tax=unclassified Halomonas TaxID=2609666 RepID=UPI00131C4560|nr:MULTISPECIES: hypothetical protein [unclassified Halomonas]
MIADIEDLPVEEVEKLRTEITHINSTAFARDIAYSEAKKAMSGLSVEPQKTPV